MKTGNHTPESFEAFETRLSRSLEHIASQTPTSNALEFDPAALPLLAVGTEPNRRLVRHLTAAAAAAVVVTGIVAITNRMDGRPAAAPPVTTAPGTTLATTPLAVRGVPICGPELPITLEVPSATSGPNPGPAVYGPTSEGQFAQNWELPAGTIEVRWPADPREIYDLERRRGNPAAFDAMATGVMADGTQASIQVPTIDPYLAADRSTLTMSTTSSTAMLSAQCKILQVRYIDRDGNQTTRGYNIANFNSDPMLQRDDPMQGGDLNPLIISTEASAGPDPATMVSCGEGDVDTNVTGPASTSAANALLAFLESGQFPALLTSGYREYTPSDNETLYAIITADRLITHITVTHTADGWTVTRVRAPGC